MVIKITIEDFMKMPTLPNIQQQNRLDMLKRKEERIIKRIAKRAKYFTQTKNTEVKNKVEKKYKNNKERLKEKVDCDICGKTYSRNGIYQHKKIHTKTKKLKIDFKISEKSGQRYITRPGKKWLVVIKHKYYGSFKYLADAIEKRDEIVKEIKNEKIKT